MDDHVPAYKIGSGDITWLEMIERVASKNKPYFLATGAATADEVHQAVRTALNINPKFALMQCNTNYTASLDNFKYIQLNVLKTYRSMYPDLVLGLSDHTPGHATVLGAVALGARMIEKHFTDDINRVGPDHAFSMDPFTWREMVDRTRELEYALGNGIKKVEENESETVVVQRRSLRAKKDLSPRHVINDGDFIPLRPCPRDALTPAEIKSIIGRSIRREILEGDYLRVSDLE
jgi:N-acetylneuraminate synthase